MWSAYQQTRYVAWPDRDAAARAGRGGPAGARELEIRVGASSPALDAFLAARGAASWCFVTAANPGSERRSDAENARRNRNLEAELEAAGLVALRGEGRGADGAWPAEPSFLVLGVDRDEALRLGGRHGQNAVVFGEVGGPAELIDCRGAEPAHGAANG